MRSIGLLFGFAAVTLPTAVSIDCSFSSTYPRQYVAYYTDVPPVIDGILNDTVWEEVAFTESFVDISTTTKPAFSTIAGIRWDNEWLYIAAVLRDTAAWANITSACHCIDPTHDQVIYHDNDFEVFVNPDGSNWYYKEFEMNVAAATWDLCLNRPYIDGGYENSSRVFGPAGFDMQPPLQAAAAADGAINNPNVPHSQWTLEIAMPLSKLVYNTSATVPPTNGTYWQINFSRVEWAVKVINDKYEKFASCQSCPTPGAPVEDNWVWSPMGAINMHLPDKWGWVQFSDAPVNTTKAVPNPEWPLRSVAMAVYYAEHAYASANGGVFTDHIVDLVPYAPDNIFDGTCTQVPSLQVLNGGSTFNAIVPTLDGSQQASINDLRYLRLQPAE